jgi:hypothetical protein
MSGIVFTAYALPRHTGDDELTAIHCTVRVDLRQNRLMN